LRLKNPVIYRKSDLCQAIERELMTVLGVEKYKTGSITCSVQVDNDPRELTRDQMVEILDSALDNAEHPTKLDKLDHYTRRLRRPIDGPTRAAIANEYSRRRHEIPVPTELQWHPDRPQFTIRAQWLSFCRPVHPRCAQGGRGTLAGRQGVRNPDSPSERRPLHRLDRERSGPLSPRARRPEDRGHRH